MGIVMKAGCGRVGLPQLQQHVAGTLHPSKWPQAIVYMDRYDLFRTADAPRFSAAYDACSRCLIVCEVCLV